MFYHLEGTVSELTAESIVLDCSGVGFEVTITPNTASALKIGEKAKLYRKRKTVFLFVYFCFRHRPESRHVYSVL